jgi:pimeloyl-ACP methyl ester carboxylesterase
VALLAPAGYATGPTAPPAEVVELSVADRPLSALYDRHRRTDGRGAAVILHAPGSHADDPQLMRPLRHGLNEAGWDTLAPQLPRFLPPGESPPGWVERHGAFTDVVAEASAWLRGRGQRNQVVIGVGASGLAALAAAADGPPETLQAVVLISTPMPPESPALERLQALKLPVLDLYAERDSQAVLDAAAAKRRAMRDNSSARQRVLPGATDGFDGVSANLVGQVRAWLAANVEGRTLSRSDKGAQSGARRITIP